jgi:AcrR family transcriptional regulator
MNDDQFKPSATDGVQAPQQSRSQRTMNRILDAAEKLLDEKSFQELTINDIVQEAGCSVGAFYGRFKDKDTLLHALDERLMHDLVMLIETTIADSKWASLTLNETIKTLVEMMVEANTQRMGVMRTVILQAKLIPDPRFREREDQLNAAVPRLIALILAHEDEIQHPQPALAAQLGFLQIHFAIRELMLWPHIASAFPVSKEQLTAECTRMYSAYLGVQSQ